MSMFNSSSILQTNHSPNPHLGTTPVYGQLLELHKCASSQTEETVREQFSGLPKELSKKIFGLIYELAGKPKTKDAQWGKNHAFESLPRLQEAIQKIAFQAFDDLTSEQRGHVAGRVYHHSGSPKTSDAKWGRNHAKDNVEILLHSLDDYFQRDTTPEPTVAPQILKEITEHLQRSHRGRDHAMELQIQGTLYKAWFSEQSGAFNVQPKVDHQAGKEKNKLNIQVNGEGAITSLSLNGSKVVNNTMPNGKAALLIALHEVCPKPPQFSSNDLATFRAALISLNATASNPQLIEVDGILHAVWFNGHYGSINIQEGQEFARETQNKKLGVIINPQGQITSVRVNNIAQIDNSLIIPEESVPLMERCFIKALEISSHYAATPGALAIGIIRRGIKELPEFHLNEFSQHLGLTSSKIPSLSVKFLRNDLQLDQGIDAGGLSRDYIDDLSSEILHSKALKFAQIASSSLLMPRTSENYTNGQPLPNISPTARRLYTSIGRLMMYCYNVPDRDFSIGRHFDESLFKAAFCLSKAEIETPFDQLAMATKMKMCKALAEATDSWDTYKDRITLLSKPSLNAQELGQACLIASYSGSLPDDFDPDAFDPTNSEHKEIVKKALADSLFDYIGGTALAPIHAIAQGMFSICNGDWATIDSKVFSDAIQGSLDRAEIARRIALGSGMSTSAAIEIQKKVNWIKEWLQDPNTPEEEVRKFVKFVTGCSSLPQGRQITVEPQSVLSGLVPVPRAHTCFFQMDISPSPTGSTTGYNDRTKAAFIRSLRELALTDPDSYSMS